MIQIKRNNKVFFTLEEFGEGSKLSYQLMDHHYVILKFTTATPVYFEIGDSVEIPDFGYFELTSSYFPKHNDSDGYDYEMQMDAYYMSWKNKICKYRPQHGANETSFNLTTTVGVHMNVILGNLKALGLTYNGKDFSVDYTTYNNKAFDVQKRFLIEYGSISILDALNAICSEDALNCEWWIDGSIIYLGYCEMEGQTTFEQDVNVLSMSYSESKSTYITRLYAFGSDRNIPKGYFTGADADVTTDGVATDYLMLPNKEVDSDGFYAKDGYLENVNVVKNDKQAIEGVVMFEEEYPKVESVVSSIKTYDSTVDNEDGTKTTQTFWQVTSTDSFTNSFKESWIKSNLTLGIKFTSGALMGMEFDVSFKVIDKVNYFEIVANDTYGRTLPDGVMCPKVGDKYFLFNWDATKITDTDLIPTAQLSLFDRAKQYYQKTMISNSNFTCTMDGDKFYNDGTYDYHPLGEQVKLINDMFAQVDADGRHYRNSRIIGMEIPLDIPYDHPQYTVGEKAATSRLGKLEDKVDSIKVNGMQIGGTGSGNGGGVYVIGMNDTTPASDSNVYSARRSRMEFVSRLQDNTAKGTITWEKVQKFFSGLHVGNSNNENGGSWIPDAEGRSHLITDYLEVRMKAIFEELVINKTSTIGGKEIISPAGGVVAHKVEEVTVTYNNVSQKAYRCYFLAEQDGDEVDNDFAVNDQVRSESFNVRKGTYHKVGNHFYWRLVIGRDEDPVELEGKKYHYIDLSDTDCATASDVPAKGDVLNQCGNRTDVERQNCLIFSAVDTYSPSISLYHGINSYSFANREYVEYGVNKQTNKAFFHVYGDMYFGDRPTSANNYEGDSYVKYDSDKKKVTIKGDLDIKSTYDGKTLDKYIADESLDKNAVETIIKKSDTIIDLQNQIDGAIETWFYDGVPTLLNAPAVGWTTDNDKKTHLGDLYYDNKTGKAYRFAKDGSTYKWIIITDTELTKALEDSSQALKDAKSKRRIFGSQPVPPYDVNDMWVNATYPSDGSTYKNEILKCSTSKAEGEEFDIADWKLASKYTDDTKAEEAKKAAEKAQAEIKDTQTNLIALGTTVSNNKKAFDAFTSDGYLDSSEIAAIAQDSKRLEDDYNAAVESYNNVVGSKFLLDKDGKETTYKTDLVSAKATLYSAKNELITYLSDIVSRYNASDSNEKATIKAAAAQKYTNFTNAYKAFYDKLGVANNYITSNLFDGLNTKLITNMAGLEYIKAALVDGDTVVKGGLILSTLIALRNDKGNVTAGINGADTKENGIALWLGGKAIDKQASTTTEEEKKIAAKSLLRFDGTGYFANGNLWWDADGTLHADPTSFIINKNNVGVQLALFAPVWKSGTTDTTKLANVLSIDPQKPFTHLDVSGNVTTEGSLKIGGIYLSYDSANNALRLSKDAAGKEAANFYALGGITAYGAGASTTGGGGGLNGSVKSYSNALKLTSESLSEIASAYSIKALDSRISSLEGGSATAISVSGSGNAVTSVTKNGTTISVVKGSTFLTAHQSLAGYMKTATADAKYMYHSRNNIVSDLNSFATNGAAHIYEMNNVTNRPNSNSWVQVMNWGTGDSDYGFLLANDYSTNGHMYFRQKIAGSWKDWKTIIDSSNIGSQSVNYAASAGSVAWTNVSGRPSTMKNPSALSWSGYSSGSYDGSAAKSISIPNNTNQLTNGAGFITASASITGNAATATKVNHSLSVFGKSFNGSADVTVADTDLITSILSATANLTDKTEILTSYASDNGFNDSNAKNRIYRRPASAIWGYINSKTISNADKLDNVHLNGIFTALSNTNNGVSMTIGTVAKSLANMQVYSATKLVTARNIALNGDFTGNANFDGSANITINCYMSYCKATVSNTNTYPWRRIAKVNEITGNYSDGCILLYISEGFNGGYYGIARIYIRTDNLSTGANASCSIQWISRNGYGLDSLKIAMYKTTGKAYYDVFLKMRGVHASVVIRTLQDQRGGLGKIFTLVNSTETTNAASHTEAYATIEDAATAIHNQAYTSIAQGYDVATVHNADMVDGIHASGLFTNLSNSGNSLSITVGGTNKTLTVNYASNAGNADTVDSLHVHSGRNSEANKIVRTDGKGFIQCGYINSDKGNEGNNSSPARVWGTNGSDNYLRSYLTSALSVKYAASAGNADTLDGVHASGLFTNLSNSGNKISITIGGTNKTLTAAYATNCDTLDGYHAQLGSSKPYGKIPVIGTDGVIELGHYIDFHHDNTTGSDYSVRLQTNGNHSNVVTLPTATGTLALTSDNVASATKLQTARTIWGQSFNGTANVSGALSGATTISASNTISTTLQNGALKIGNKSTPISAIDEQVIFNTGGAIRFGETAWDRNQWAGLKYNHSSKTIYLGIADGSVFNANSAQSGGKLNLINCSLEVPGNIYMSGMLTVGKNIRLVNMATNVDALFAQLNGNSLSIGYGSRMYATTQMWCNKFAIYCNEGITLLNIDKVTATFETNILATGGVTAYASSDARLKTDLRKLDYLGIIKAMGGTFGFAWKKDNTRSIGWIAQHVLCNPHLKDIVETDEKGYYKINYWSPKLIATAFGAIEQVGDEVSRLKARVVFLESEVQRLSGKQGSSDKKRLDNKNINLLN